MDCLVWYDIVLTRNLYDSLSQLRVWFSTMRTRRSQRGARTPQWNKATNSVRTGTRPISVHPNFMYSLVQTAAVALTGGHTLYRTT